MDELKVDLKPETYTELTVTVVDYEGTKRVVTICDSGWDHDIQSLHEMWTRLLGGMGRKCRRIGRRGRRNRKT